MVMAIIKEFYPAFHKDKTPEQIQVSVRLWHEMFKDDDGNQVLAAVKAFVATDTKGFPPSVGQIKQRLVQLNALDMPDEAEAWGQVWKAIQNSGYHSKEEFDKEHSVIRFTTAQKDMNFKIMSAFKSEVFYENEKDVFRYYDFINSKSKKEYKNFVKNAKKASIYDTGVTSEYGDSLITLITCSYHKEDGRFVLIGRE